MNDMGGKRGESRCDMLPNIKKAIAYKIKRNGLKKKVCRLKKKKRRKYMIVLLIFVFLDNYSFTFDISSQLPMC